MSTAKPPPKRVSITTIITTAETLTARDLLADPLQPSAFSKGKWLFFLFSG